MAKDVKEMYEGEDTLKDSKYLLIIYSDGTLKLTWYYKDKVVEEPNPVLRPSGKGLRLEYGNSKVLSSVPFTGYNDGVLDKRWEKIK